MAETSTTTLTAAEASVRTILGLLDDAGLSPVEKAKAIRVLLGTLGQHVPFVVMAREVADAVARVRADVTGVSR